MTTKEKHINMLRGQIEKLDQKPFDLESWKKYTIVLLSSIFGDESQKIKQVEKIEYEYTSWSLRDTTGHSSYLESCKKLGREILQVAIMELEDFGDELQHRSRQGQIDVSLIIDALNDELTGTQYRALLSLTPKSTKRLNVWFLKNHVSHYTCVEVSGRYLPMFPLGFVSYHVTFQV